MPTVTMCGADSKTFFNDIALAIEGECKGRQVIYVSMLRPYAVVMEGLQEAGIKAEDVFIVDCSSKDSYPIDMQKNATFLNGQKDLTAIGIAVNQAAKHIQGEKTVIIVSVGMLFLYNDTKIVLGFLKFLTDNLRGMNINTILVVTKDDPTGKDSINMVKTFCDEVKKI